MLTAKMDLKPGSFGRTCVVTDEAKRLPFYLDGIGHFECDERYFTRRSGLHNYLILLTRGGAGAVEYGGRAVTLAPDEAFFLDCDAFQYYRTRDAGGWSLDWLHLNGAAAETYYGLVAKSSNHVRLMRTEIFRHDFAALCALPEEQTFATSLTACRHLLSLVTELLLSNADTVRAAHVHEPRMQAVLRRIESGYDGRITLDELAALANLSKFHFIHVFEDYTGAAPMAYLTGFRLGQAKRLLLTSTLPVAEIAGRVGFPDGSYFIRLFRRHNGMTPGEYRKRHM